MSGYADTGLLCSLYAPDAHSSRAAARMKRQALPLPVSWLHQLEFRNAMRLRVFRREITPAQRDASMNAMLGDMAAGILTSVTAPIDRIMMEAERLSASNSEILGTRSLDILHVATALVLGCTEFLTFDARQSALAKAAGLKTPIR